MFKNLMLKFYALEPSLLHPLSHFSVGLLLAWLSKLLLISLHSNHSLVLVIPVVIASLAGLVKESIDYKFHGEFSELQFLSTVVGGLFSLQLF